MFSKVVLALALLARANANDRTMEAKFFDHMAEFGLDFIDSEEFEHRFEIFSKNDALIQEHNAGNSTYTLGHNQFSTLTFEEFKEMNNLGQPITIPPKTGKLHTAPAKRSAVTAVDWTSAGAVTPVKDQGSCGSCWAFSTTGSMEGAYSIANNEDVSSWTGLSEQQLVACDTIDSGCNGGLMDNAFGWAESNGGLCTEEDYPYASSSGTSPSCSTSCTEKAGTTPTTYTDVDSTEDALMSAVEQQPVSVAIQANQFAFQLYSSGVLTGRCGTSLDHGVLAVGYGTYTDGTDYWKVKNSWASSWGMDGYILIERGNSQTGGECGILLSASYPTL